MHDKKEEAASPDWTLRLLTFFLIKALKCAVFYVKMTKHEGVVGTIV